MLTRRGGPSGPPAAIVAMALAAPVFAHHSVLPYDGATPTTITGTVVKVLWQNPHAYIDYRVIPTDGRTHLAASIKTWHGDPVGHWEGDTLVVDYTNLNGKHWFDMAGNFQSENIHVVERYTMFTPDTIHFVATDATMYTRPWTLNFSLERNKEPGYYQLEYACHEGERDLQHFTDDTRK